MLNENNNQICPLCQSDSKLFYEDKPRVYYKCSNCFAIYLDRNHLPDNELEKERYLEHNNDVNDPRYQKFVSPIVSSVLNDFTKKDYGLDFGGGTGPVISKLLRDQGFQIEVYDPFFRNEKSLLNKKYNYIVCCEVIEHFHNPKEEFELLKGLLLPGGKLYCMTDLYDESIEFSKWYYKNDPTHVFIYHQKTLEWIKENLKFAGLKVDGRLAVFKNCFYFL